MFIWTVEDVIGGIVLALILIGFILCWLGAGWDKLKARFRKKP